MEKQIRDILKAVGEDPSREGLLKTPERVTRSLQFLTKGYKEDPLKLINGAIFHESKQQDMVIVKDIDFYSLCEHHLLPFFGKCHIAYIPNGRILGLSKFARLIDIYARRLQVQERMTHQIAEILVKTLKPKGVAVVAEAKHLCMQMRGVERQNSVTVTSSMLGEFRKNDATRKEFMALIGHRHA